MNKEKIQRAILVVAAFILVIQFFGLANLPAQGARRYQYRVISVSGMTELKTQSNTDQGRVASIEKVIQGQSDAGWEFVQADGYLLYFRR